MKKEILENQILTSQMLYFDKPLKEVVFTGPRPTPRPGSHEMPPMALRDAIKPVELLENGDVLFRFFAPDAKCVEVAGWGGGFPRDRIALTKGEDGWWSTTVSGILPGFHYHDFFVDGTRLINPDSAVGYGGFYPANFFELPSDEDEFWMLRDVPHGDLRMEYFRSSETGRVKACWVYTPPGYDEGDERYPVLYLQHGGGENETGWIWQGKINMIADNMIADGLAKPMIIVMNTGYAFKKDQKYVFFPGDFDAELTRDCIPFIDRRFRTLADKHHRAVAGLSLGSSLAFRSALQHPDLFGSMGIFSGGFPIARAEYDFTEYFADPERFNRDFDFIFVAGGEDEGFCERTLPVLDELRAKGIRITDYHHKGFHVWDVWRFCAYNYLLGLFQ